MGIGQPGFSKWYDFETSSNFHNVILKGDTLVIAGTSIDSSLNQWGALFVQMDTLGNVLNHHLELDSLGNHLIFSKGSSLIETQDKGFFMAGTIVGRNSYFLLKFNEGGEKEFYKEFPYPSNLSNSFPRDIVIVNDNHWLFSSCQQDNGAISFKITVLDSNGNMLWEKPCGTYGIKGSFNSVWVEDNNSIVIGNAVPAGPSPIPSPVDCSRNRIIALDSTGNVKWHWLGLPCEGDVVYGINKTNEGGWIYSGRNLEIFNPTTFGGAPIVVKRDAEFNLLWEYQVADSFWDANFATDLAPTPEGQWVGGGRWVLPEPYPNSPQGEVYQAVCLFKISEQGIPIWTRCDTVTTENHTYNHEFGRLVVLPSGSVVGVGSFKESQFGPHKMFGWVFKVDKDGCLEEPCIVNNLYDLNSKKNHVEIFPNPAEDYFRISCESKANEVTLINSAGKVLKKWANSSDKFPFNISSYPPGLYFVGIKTQNIFVVKKIIIK